MYSRDQVKAFTDKIFNMSGADNIEVNFSSSERSGTRFANSSISANLVQFDQQLTITTHIGAKSGSSNTRDFSDASLKTTFDEAIEAAKVASERPSPAVLLGAQQYIPVDAALPAAKAFGPAERAKMVRTSIDISKKMGTVGAGFIPKTHQTTCDANSKGLFAFEEVAEASFILTCRMPDGSGSGWAGTTGIKDISMINPVEITEVASKKALDSRKARALEPGRYTVILEPRANARFLSLMTGIFSGGGGQFMRDKKPGDKIFSDLFTLKSDIGNPTLRQSSILGDNTPAAPVTWLDKGVLRNLSGGPNSTSPKANLNMSLVMEGSDLSTADMIKQTKRGLLVTFFWYIRGVDNATMLNTGMTRDGLFLIENGEISIPVQNFRWNMSPLVGYNNISLVGKSVPMHMGESYDGAGTALVPPVRIEDFYMTSLSPAV
ncbi:MAG: TldD/PmbA family protein [Vicinamibacterales bacterium]